MLLSLFVKGDVKRKEGDRQTETDGQCERLVVAHFPKAPEKSKFYLDSSFGQEEKVQLESRERAQGFLNVEVFADMKSLCASPLSGGCAAVKSGSINQLSLYHSR